MKVLFVVKSKVIECLGPMYLAAVIKQAGHEAKIVDINTAYNVALSWRPRLIGYSVMTGDQKRFIALNEQIRCTLPVAYVFGGAHATFFPDDFPEDPVAVGESEGDIANLLKFNANYLDLDSLPWPDRTDFPNMKIRDFLASRGCSSSCSYCYNSAWNKMFPNIAKVRTRSPQDVVDEVAGVNPQFAYFQDSNFGAKMSWMREFSRRYCHVSVPYHAHLRPNLVNEERALLLHDSNCVSVKCALETGSDRLKKLINRGHSSNGDVYVAARHLKKWGIKLILQNILALPSSTIEEDLLTLEVNIKVQPAYSWCSIFQPYPATVLGDWCVKEGIYKGDYSEIGDNFFDHSVLEFDDEHKEQIEVLQRVFALCVEHQYLPKVEELRYSNLGKLIHKIMRITGDKRMFPGIL